MNDRDYTKHLQQDDKDTITSSGIDLSEGTRSASFMQQDNEVLFFRAFSDALDIMSREKAFREIPESREYFGRAFRYLGREFDQNVDSGYFIRVKKGQTVEMPIQACMFLKQRGFTQKVHNVVVVEEGAKLHLITGCSASKSATEGIHLGTTEFFIQKGGYLNSTMIHSWKEDVTVRPVSIALVEEGGVFISNYVCLKPVKNITMFPTAVLLGEHARASLNSMVMTFPNTHQDIGSRIIFKAKNTQGEIISRNVSLGGKNIARGHMRAEAENVKAHLECRGLLLAREGAVYAVPELETEYRDVDMSHEAAIGRINNEEIEYLVSRGMSHNEAQSVIIRGFMDVSILSLPDVVRKEIDTLEEQTLSGGF